jgi:hypothetical protein
MLIRPGISGPDIFEEPIGKIHNINRGTEKGFGHIGQNCGGILCALAD